MKSIKYSPALDVIKNFRNSNIAYIETNDCVVRAIAAAVGWEYDTAHKFVENKFRRKFGKGTYYFATKLTKIALDGIKLNGKSISIVSLPHHIFQNSPKTTVGSFIKTHQIGTYILSVTSHTFTVKDGGVIGGNSEDAIKVRRLVKSAWRIN
jgi:hypothetical protein